MNKGVQKNVTVVVLGDIGRSPRMQYHCKSLSEMGHFVDIVAYGNTEPMEEIKKRPLIYYHYLLTAPVIPLRFINYIFKTIWQAFNLLFLLFITRRPEIILVQNPPAIPSLVICWIFAKIVKAKLIIDWHNYAHSIMALSLSKRNILVRLTSKVEEVVGRLADANFCVTNAMKKDLKDRWGIEAVTLYDRPPDIFHTITLPEKHNFLKRLSLKYKILSGESSEDTLFTYLENGIVKLRQNRPGLIISSTSWTEDEDFSLLLIALQAYEDNCRNGNLRKLPHLVCIITGKGPLKEHYVKKLAVRDWKNVSVITPWLESSDYPLLLASADLGVSLHTSSSGLDLPMKVVDMFGSGLPVLACDFKCLDELVKHEENGYKFSSSQELSELIQKWFENFPNNIKQIEIEKRFKTNLKTFCDLRWEDNWNNLAAPKFI